MRNIYMLQVNYPYGNTAHLPYTAGALLSYAMADHRIGQAYRLKKIFFLREDPASLLEKIEEPAVIGFCCYIWNFEYNKHIAREVKKRWPSCVTIFGGHHVTPGGGLLETAPYIDYLIHGEGEEAFRRLPLHAAGEGTLSDIRGISYRAESGAVTTPSAPPLGDDVIDYPSPYLNGFFDDILAENPDKTFMGLIETTRGCPNSCSYCDWSEMKSRIRKFPLERVFGEIRWISEHRIYGLGSADSNFGVFERDEEITDYIIQMHLQNGFPKAFQTSYAKNSNERIFRIGCALEKYQLSKGITLSFQSMNEEALANVGRKNISLAKYEELMDLYNAAGISTYTELILGLPGETYESFVEGIDRLLRMGQHNSIYIHNCEWLPCSAMGKPEYVEKYGIRTAKIPLNLPHIEGDHFDPIPEYSRLVIATCSMRTEDWIAMNLFSFTVQCFHHMGVFQLLSLYLYQEHGVGYAAFYEKVLRWLLDADNHVGQTMREMKRRLEDIAAGVPGAGFVIADDRFGSVRWPFEEYLYLCTVWELDAFYDDAKSFLSAFFAEDAVFEDLMAFQRAMVKRPFGAGGQLTMPYNFEAYFLNALGNRKIPLEQGAYKMEIPAANYESWSFYAKKVVWYGRKDNRNLYLGGTGERSET